ncbi:MAG: FABP family protein [Deltaproteobacteria bacterium]|nr:FABP family protein [Deltaproteobacteria bacterium]MBW1874757.1 FABP family protein [Deltaproteobacteria bacterium]MBW2211816.1 FABP family protein [Deltaproteobacteria bacterium]MBW2379648.1 FABP family protein [Deltaproteobacteria bacterium]MBW2550206.1 FABP family protein [Deltaproteobacteria bacterium]
MTDDNIRNLGPLAPFAGMWEGTSGVDIAPDDDRVTVERNEFSEHVVLEPIGLVQNHEQSLYGLRYAKTAWRLGAEDPFHEEVGYWLWDAAARQVMLSFIVPRGVTVLAGGMVEPDAKSFKLAAEVGSEVFGICSGPFLDEQFKTVRYDIELTVNEDGSFSYAQNTQLQIKGQSEIFAHTDDNTLRKVE